MSEVFRCGNGHQWQPFDEVFGAREDPFRCAFCGDRPVPKGPSKAAETLRRVFLAAGISLVLVCAAGLTALRQLGNARARAARQDREAFNQSMVMFGQWVVSGNDDAIYAGTTEAFKSSHSPEQFRTWRDQHPALREATGVCTFAQRVGNASPANVGVTVSGPRSSVSLALVLAKEGTQWKIDALRVTPSRATRDRKNQKGGW